MGSYTEQDNYQQTLMYDTTAFLHYLNSILAIIVIILVFLIMRDLRRKIKSKFQRALEQDQIYRDKARNTWHLKQKQSTKHIKWRFFALLVCLACIALCVRTTSGSGELTGFDPYEILNVDQGANTTQIKKAYRKLALEMHPDRKKDDSTSTQFILISKAYKCLTDAKTKQNCIKYGNPDGQIYKKFGIGLPSVILKNQYENYVALILLTLLLVVIPCAFFRWTSTLKQKKSLTEHLIQSNEVAYLLMTPKLNIIDCCLILGCMKDLQNVFAPHHLLTTEQSNQFVKLILKQSNLTEKELSLISPQKLYRCLKIYQFMTNQNDSIELACVIPKLCQQIIKFASIFGKRSLQGFLLAQNSDLTVNWYGLAPCKRAIQFSKIMMTKSSKPLLSQLVQQNITEKQKEAKKLLLTKNLHELVSCEETKKQLVQQFNKKTGLQLKKYLDCLPSISLNTKVKCDGCEVSEVSANDVICVEANITKNNTTQGQVVNPYFPVLAKEEFLLIISSNSNLLSSYFFSFEETQTITHVLELKRLNVGLLRINISVYSLCYVNYETSSIKAIEVLEKLKKKRVVFHEEDLKVEKMSKNFFEALIDLKIHDQSDRELSESQQDDKQREKPVKRQKKRSKKVKMNAESDSSERNTRESS